MPKMTKQEIIELYNIIDKYWADFDANRNEKFVVKPSIPVIWFGDIYKYWESPKRIVTVAINPSNHEFTNEERIDENTIYSPAVRFGSNGVDINAIEQCKSLKGEEGKKNKKDIIQCYNNYFCYNPYNKWRGFFTGLEWGLQNLPGDAKASYVTSDGKDKLYENITDYTREKETYNIAIHIDCQSALATEKLWTNEKLERFNNDKNELKEFRDLKKQLSQKGEVLFTEFLSFLDPDIILFLSNEKKLNKHFKIRDEIVPLKTLCHGQKIGGYMTEGKNHKKQILIYRSNNSIAPFVCFALEPQKEYIGSVFDKLNVI